MGETPKTYGELFGFYTKYVKPLYSTVQASNALPTEVLFEINAAFDHLSRAWAYQESEEKVVAKAYSHLKRSCLDVYKLRVKEILEQYEALKKIDTSIIDNGDFDKEMHLIMHAIKTGATEARRSEGKAGANSDEVPAFGYWEPVYENCLKFEDKFYFHPKLDWAKKKNIRLTYQQLLLGTLGTLLIGVFLEHPLEQLLDQFEDYCHISFRK